MGIGDGVESSRVGKMPRCFLLGFSSRCWGDSPQATKGQVHTRESQATVNTWYLARREDSKTQV